MSAVADLPVVERVTIDEAAIRAYTDEEDFTVIAFDLLKEVAGEVCVSASIMGTEASWNRNQAIIGGLIVRLSKLLRSMLGEAMRREGELMMITGRLAFETIINVVYLIENQNDELFEDFVRYSLRTERKLRDRIMRNAVQRGDGFLPIERRMLESVERAAVHSGIRLDDVDIGNSRGWGKTTIRDRAEKIGMVEAYDNLFTMASHAVHGNWQDLLGNHLQVEDGRFQPHLEWKNTRPQMLFSISVFALHAVVVSAGWLGGEASYMTMRSRAADLDDRIRFVSEAHDAFLGG